MARAWEENVRKVEPYTPGEQPKDSKVIKLNTNENPYGVSPEVTFRYLIRSEASLSSAFLRINAFPFLSK